MHCFRLDVYLGFGIGAGSIVYCLPGEILLPEDKAIGTAVGEAFRLIISVVFLKVGWDILFACVFVGTGFELV